MNATELTKREYFAALAMQAIISAAGNQDGSVDYEEGRVAQNAVAMADALIAELKLRRKP